MKSDDFWREKETQKKNRKDESEVEIEEQSWLEKEQPWAFLIEWRGKVFVSMENERKMKKIMIR